MSHLALSLLGPFQTTLDGESIPFSSLKARALLAYLAVESERPHSREALTTLLWPEEPAPVAHNNFRHTLSSLRKAIGDRDRVENPLLLVTHETVQFNYAGDCGLDVRAFQEGLRTADTDSQLIEAVAFYRGDFLEGFHVRGSAAFEDWMRLVRDRLERQAAAALQHLVEIYEGQGNYEHACDYAWRQVELERWQEQAHRQLMRLLALTGRRSEALAQYEACCRLLAEELAVEPAAETRALYEQIRDDRLRPVSPPISETLPIYDPAFFTQEKLGEIGRPVQKNSGYEQQGKAKKESVRHNLPAQLTSFIGREAEVSALQTRLREPDCRLLTLVGPGGVGKTRLALEVALGILEHFADGVFFVALATISDPGLVLPIIARALDMREVQGFPLLESLKDFLQEKQLLLVLDNFEHVADAAPAVTDLLAAAPQLQVLATSRAVLQLYGESIYLVPPLLIPEDLTQLPSLEHLAAYPGVQLFIKRAREAQPHFVLTLDNAQPVAELCARLDGLPLAIELAAARVRLLPPRNILAQLESSQCFLRSQARDIPARQRALHDTIDWSYNLLAGEEKTLFRRLAVFMGGCTLEAAGVVCVMADDPSSDADQAPDMLGRLESLVDQSLLKASEVDGEPRFDMLETIRQYALECLIQSGEAETTHWQHANFFLALAEKAEPQLRGAEQVDWLNRLETEHNNLRKALIWFREQARDKIQGLRLAIALYWFWGVHSFWSEGVTWLTQFLDLTKTSSHTAVRAKALNCAGHLAWLRQDFALAHTLHTESLAICRKLEDQQGIADALFGLGRVARLQGNYAAAGTFYEESLAIQRELGNKTGIADTLLYLGAGVTFYEDLTLAQSLLEESLAMWRELKVKSGIAPTLNKLGRIAQLQGNYGEAKSLYLEGLKLFRELGDKFGPAYTLHDLGCVALYQDDRQRANSYFKESLALYQELKLKDGIVDCLTGLTKIAMMNGQLERAARLCGAIETLLEFLDDQHTSDKVEYTRMAATVHVHLDEALYRSAWVEGQAMTMKQAIDYALSGEVWV